VEKIQRLLGWQTRVSFEEGVRRMLERLEDWRDAPVWDPASISKATSSWFRYLGEEASC
jgi:UDP-glucose 4-epimerase